MVAVGSYADVRLAIAVASNLVASAFLLLFLPCLFLGFFKHVLGPFLFDLGFHDFIETPGVSEDFIINHAACDDPRFNAVLVFEVLLISRPANDLEAEGFKN